MKAWKRDVIYSVVIIAICALFWSNANTMTSTAVSQRLAQPTVYTHMVLGILMLLSLAQLVRALRTRPQDVREPIWDKLSAITVIACVLYVVTIKKMGFLLNSFLLLSILYISYSVGANKIDISDKKKMWTQIAIRIVVSGFITVVVYVIFRYLLKSQLPKFNLF